MNKDMDGRHVEGLGEVDLSESRQESDGVEASLSGVGQDAARSRGRGHVSYDDSVPQHPPPCRPRGCGAPPLADLAADAACYPGQNSKACRCLHYQTCPSRATGAPACS